VRAKARSDRGRPVIFTARAFNVDTLQAWFLCCLVLWVFFLPLYVTRRGNFG
jgi:hypothetical protein